MIKVAIVGATGYAGEELLNVLVRHAQVKITSLTAKMDKPEKINRIFPQLSGKLDLVCAEPDFSKEIPDCDLVFLALPHRVSMQIAPKFLQAKKKVIDLSADYRLKDAAEYSSWYDCKHTDPKRLKQAIYGLPEINRKRILQAQLVANPGCYPTAVILASLPLLAKKIVAPQPIIADAKSGLSGAGREKEAQLAVKMQDNFCAYKVDAHQHSPEIDQELSGFTRQKIKVVFTPQLIPIKRGILSTVYFQLNKKLSTKQAQRLYQDFYHKEPFVQVLPEGEFPQIKDVVKSNYCSIGIKISSDQKTAIVVSAIDNLIKGASGQAVQNMNIMYGFKEKEGLL